MRFKSLLIGAAAIVGVVAATSMMTACGNQAIGETTDDVSGAMPSVTGNSGIDESGDTLTNGDALGTEATLDGVSIVCPSGWVVTEQSDEGVTVTQDDGDGRIDINLGGTSAQVNIDDLFDGEANDAESDSERSSEYVVGNTTWHGYEVESGFTLEATDGNGSVVGVVGRGVTIDEAMDMLSGITLL